MKNERGAKTCVVCDRDDYSVPLIAVQYRSSAFWICPQHLPTLIHDPGQLAHKLPGAENLDPSDHKD